MNSENDREATGDEIAAQIDVPPGEDPKKGAAAREALVSELLQGVVLPVCPYCNQDPFDPQYVPIDFGGGFKGKVFFCGNQECRKVINVQVLTGPASNKKQAPPTIALPSKKIIIPGGDVS